MNNNYCEKCITGDVFKLLENGNFRRETCACCKGMYWNCPTCPEPEDEVTRFRIISGHYGTYIRTLKPIHITGVS